MRAIPTKDFKRLQGKTGEPKRPSSPKPEGVKKPGAVKKPKAAKKSNAAKHKPPNGRGKYPKLSPPLQQPTPIS